METESSNKLNLTGYFNSKQLTIFLILVTLGLTLRWYALDHKPLHHDESLHYMYSVYPIDNPDLYYHYDPMLHGPMLYTLQPLVFRTFGINIASSRILPALIGSIILLVPWLLRSRLSPWSVIATTAFLALSPSLVYWSRFIIHDLFEIIGIVLVLLGALSRNKRSSAFWISLGLVFQFGTKENCYVTLAIFIGYLIVQFAYIRLSKEKEEVALFIKILNYLKDYKRESLLGLLLFMICYSYLYTSGFRNLGPVDQGLFEQYFGSLLDGIYRKSIGYWIEQDSMERIKGPFLFHFHLYAFYETTFILLYFIHLFFFVRNSSKQIAYALALSTLCYLGTALYFLQSEVQTSQFGLLFKLKDNMDLAGLFLFFFHAVLLTFDHLIKKEYNLALFGYFFTATLFTYSYLGEKVPWLSQYPLYFAAMYFPLYFKDLYDKGNFDSLFDFPTHQLLAGIGYTLIALGACFIFESKDPTTFVDKSMLGLGAVLLVFSVVIDNNRLVNLPMLFFIFLSILTARASLLTNFVYDGEANEIMSQVHTTPEFDKIMRRIKSEIQSQKIGNVFSLYAAGEPIWPMTAYFQGITGYKYNAEPEEFKLMCYMFDTRDTKSFTAPAEFEEKEVTLRGWWLPDFSLFTIKNYLGYVINHTPWNPPGYSYAKMYINHDPTCGNSRK